MKREFQEYTAVGKDANGDDVELTTRAHVVTSDTAGEVNVRGLGAQNVPAGSVLVETDRPGVYDVITGKDWESMGLASASAVPVPSMPAADETGDDEDG